MSVHTNAFTIHGNGPWSKEVAKKSYEAHEIPHVKKVEAQHTTGISEESTLIERVMAGQDSECSARYWCGMF